MANLAWAVTAAFNDARNSLKGCGEATKVGLPSSNHKPDSKIILAEEVGVKTPNDGVFSIVIIREEGTEVSTLLAAAESDE